MAKSQKSLHRELNTATDPSRKRDLARNLLAATSNRAYIEAALTALRDLVDDDCRPVLREKALYYFDKPDKDKAGLIRQQIIELLTAIGHPDERDLYLQGLATYHHQPVHDVAQNLRAAALLGLEGVDVDLAGAWATRLLGEPDTSHFNCEPSLTAIDVLARGGHGLVIYQFMLRSGSVFVESGRAEAVGRAFERLDRDFPAELYRSLAHDYVERDIPVIGSGIAAHIVTHRRPSLYPLLRHMTTTTHHAELHRFVIVMLASARDLTPLLIELVPATPDHWRIHFTDVLELLPDDDRSALLMAL